MSIFSKKETSPATPPQQTIPPLFNFAFQMTPNGLMLVDLRGTIKAINPAALTMTNYSEQAQDAIGLNYATVFDVEDEKGNALRDGKTELAQAFQENKTFKSSSYKLTPRGSQKQLTLAIDLVPAGPTTQDDRVVAFSDITQASANTKRQLDFVATASHEMRTPVASIEGYLGLALNPQTATIDDRARSYLEEAHQACNHLGHLFKDLLDVTKLDDGSTHVHVTPVELYGAVQEILNRYDPTIIAQKNLHLHFGASGNTGGAVVKQQLYCALDVDFLQEILNNLVENAVKYTPDGGQISVNITGNQNTATISVSDTGIGINAEDLPHLFQKFYRVDNSQTRTIGGTGLGLYLVKKRAESMGGSVGVDSAPGHGTTFTVTFPRISASDYEKMRIAITNQEALQTSQAQNNINQPQGGNNG